MNFSKTSCPAAVNKKGQVVSIADSAQNQVLAGRWSLIIFVSIVLSYVGLVFPDFRDFLPLVQGILAILGCLLSRRVGPGLIVLICYALTMAFLTAISFAIDRNRLVARDFIELPKYFMILAAVAFGYSFKSWSLFYRCCILLAALSIFFGLAQVLNLDFASGLVRDKAVLEGKPISFFSTTSFAAAMYVFLASVVLSNIITSKLLINTSHAIFFVLCVMVVLTQSRTAFFAVPILLAIYLYFAFKKSPKVVGYVLIAVTALGVILLPTPFYSETIGRLGYLFRGISEYIFNWQDRIFQKNSLGLRFSQIIWAFRENNLIFIGRGVGKGYQELLESWLALYYYRFGLIGMGFYLFVWLSPMAMAISLKSTPGVYRPSFILAAAIFAIALPILSLSSSITDQVHLAVVMYVLLGAAYREWDDRFVRPQCP